MAPLKIYHCLGFPPLILSFSLSCPPDLGVRICDETAEAPPDYVTWEGPDDTPFTEALVRRPLTSLKSTMVDVLYELRLTEDAAATGLLRIN